MANRTQLQAGDIMIRKLITLREEEDIYDAVSRLLRHKISGAPVVRDGNQLVGILSEKDCIREMVRGFYEQLPALTVGDAMTREVATIERETDLLTIADLFIKNSFRRVPVVDGLELVGQISRSDLLKAITQVLTDRPQHEVGLYLSAL